MQHLYAVLTEQALQVKVLHVQRAANLTGAVVGHARAALAVAAVGYVELMAIAPGAALLDFHALVLYVTAAQVILYEARYRGILDEGGQHLGPEAQRSGNAQHVGLGAGGLHAEKVRYMHRLTMQRSYAHAHRSGYYQRVLGVLLEFHISIPPMRYSTVCHRLLCLIATSFYHFLIIKSIIC